MLYGTYNYSNVKDYLLVLKETTTNIKGFYDLACFEMFAAASLFLEASEMGQPPQPPEEQVLQELSGFFLENNGMSTKIKAMRTMSAATMDCNMAVRFKIQFQIEG
jgi:hypothetical protein